MRVGAHSVSEEDSLVIVDNRLNKKTDADNAQQFRSISRQAVCLSTLLLPLCLVFPLNQSSRHPPA